MGGNPPPRLPLPFLVHPCPPASRAAGWPSPRLSLTSSSIHMPPLSSASLCQIVRTIMVALGPSGHSRTRSLTHTCVAPWVMVTVTGSGDSDVIVSAGRGPFFWGSQQSPHSVSEAPVSHTSTRQSRGRAYCHWGSAFPSGWGRGPAESRAVRCHLLT